MMVLFDEPRKQVRSHCGRRISSINLVIGAFDDRRLYDPIFLFGARGTVT